MINFLNTVRESRLREFWPSNEPIRFLSREWGCSDAYVSLLAKRLGLPSRKGRMFDIRRIAHDAKFSNRIEARKYFDAEALKRNMSPGMLEQLLIHTICNDRLVVAILDDADQTETKAA